jgi:hypothetical protein
MKILIITGIIALITISIWLAKKSEIKPASEKTFDQQDNPINFGYKTVWVAVKTNDKLGISKILELKNVKPSNWKSGIENAYHKSVFITPQIGDWTLAVGMGLPLGDSLESIEKLEEILNKLSTEFGEAHFFGTHRVVEYHNWMKSVNGKMVRIYSYVGERMENIKVFGNPTEPETKLNLFNSLSEEAKSDAYFDREDLVFADEELVMKIAEHWSVNPTTLTERKDIKNELGFVGK